MSFSRPDAPSFPQSADHDHEPLRFTEAIAAAGIVTAAAVGVAVSFTVAVAVTYGRDKLNQLLGKGGQNVP